MVLVRLNEFPTTAGMEHKSTTFRLYKDKALKLLVDEQLESTNKDIYFNPINIPKGTVYYLKYTRNFDIANAAVDAAKESAQLDADVIEVYDNSEEYGDMLLNEDAVVEQPTITFDLNEIIEKSQLTLTSSSFRGNYGSHEYTNWIVLDSLDNVLFASIRNKTDLTSIIIKDVKDFNNKTTLKFVCAHGTLECVESKPTIFEVRTGDFNFEIKTNLTNVRPFKDLNIKFSIIEPTKPFGINKISLIDTKTKELWLEVPFFGNNFTVPWYLLRENSDLNLVIEAYDTKGKKGTVTKKIITNTYREELIKNPDKIYLENLSRAYRTNIAIPNYITTGPMNNRLIAIPNSTSRKLDLYEYDTKTKTFVSTKKTAEGINLLNRNLEGMYILPYNNDYVLIDALDQNNKPTFFIYRYSSFYDSYTLVHSITRENETKCMGYTNSIVQIRTGAFLYTPYGSKDVMKLDLNLRKVVKVNTLPIEAKSDYILYTRMDPNKILMTSNNSSDSKIYDYIKNDFREGVYVQPESFIKKATKSLMLDNGNGIIFKDELKNTEEDVMDPSIIAYHLGDEKLAVTNCRFNHRFPTSVIKLNDGTMLLSRYDTKDSGVRAPRPVFGDNEEDKPVGPDPEYMIPGEVFKPNEYSPNERILLVSANEVRTIDDPYLYDRIVIKDTGVLKWINKGVSRTFDSRDVIVTRAKEIDAKEFAKANINNLIILDGIIVKFTNEDFNSTIITNPNSLPGEIVGIDEDLGNTLVVNDGERKTIADPYAYDRIIVKGKGVLTWNSNGVERFFTSKDCIITQSSEFNAEAFNAAGYETITILDNVNALFSDAKIIDQTDKDYLAPDSLTTPSYTIHYEFS